MNNLLLVYEKTNIYLIEKSYWKVYNKMYEKTNKKNIEENYILGGLNDKKFF